MGTVVSSSARYRGQVGGADGELGGGGRRYKVEETVTDLEFAVALPSVKFEER